ncbi:MAG: hypothetical protein ABIG60_05415 [Patescibacteria group bacterium]
MTEVNIRADKLDLNFIGWKSYNRIKKKAMEQQFSWSGLIISLSIAFFIVIISAMALSFVHQSLESAKNHEYFLNQKVYHLESVDHINPVLNYDIRLNINTKYV